MKTQYLPSRTKSGSTAGRWLPMILLALTMCLVWYGGEQTGHADRMTSGETGSATVATDVLNLRTGPSMSHPVIAVLGEGETVTIIGAAQGDFLPVRSGTTTGWVARSYLEESAGGGLSSAQARESSSILVGSDDVGRPAEIGSSLPTAFPSVAMPTADLERWIRIDRSDASVALLQGDNVVAVFPGRIGRDPALDGFYSTAVGSFRVYAMNKGLAPTPFAEDTWLTDWVGFDPVRKNGIHSPVRTADGTVREWQNDTTLGCVRLSAEDAVRVFEFAEIGMRVEVVE